MKGKAMKADIYQRITDQIVTELEKGVKPCSSHGMPNMRAVASRGLCGAMALRIAASMF
jgi:antirestriction protein ArdC